MLLNPDVNYARKVMFSWKILKSFHSQFFSTFIICRNYLNESLNFQINARNNSVKLNRTNNLFFKRRKCSSLLEISRSVHLQNILFLHPAYLVACLGSEFQHYSLDCEFLYQYLFKQWPVLELQVCS